jgi:hypothetical protein
MSPEQAELQSPPAQRPPAHQYSMPFVIAGRKEKSGTVRWSFEQPRAAVVFIHGFTGECEGTWMEFPSMIAHAPECRDRDFYFFGYDSLSERAPYSASQFSQVLLALGNNPYQSLFAPSMVKAPWFKRDPFEYSEVVVVAHSLGALVARYAIIELSRTDQLLGPLAQMKLALFAPAHLGADVTLLVEEVTKLMGKVMSLAALTAKYKCPIINELEPGSAVVRRVTSWTESELARARRVNRSELPYIARKVVHASFDPIVTADPFGEDPPIIGVPDRNHSSVCKPIRDSDYPMTCLREVIRG